MSRVMALTVWQPWASLIVSGAKPFEFRRWEAPLQLIGQRIAIHAAKRKMDPAEVRWMIHEVENRLVGEEVKEVGRLVSQALRAEEALPILLRARDQPGMIPHSAIIGTAILGRPRRCKSLFGHPDTDPEMWAWPMQEARALEPIVPRSGNQGFWIWNSGEAEL